VLFMSTWARQDIQTAMAFLTTRVKNPDKDDWEILKRVLKYLNRTKYLKLKLSMDNLGILKWYVDRSHNLHCDGDQMSQSHETCSWDFSLAYYLNTNF
jgi:hypothetical protein